MSLPVIRSKTDDKDDNQSSENPQHFQEKQTKQQQTTFSWFLWNEVSTLTQIWSDQIVFSYLSPSYWIRFNELTEREPS